MSRRRDALSFSHHAEVASLEPDAADKLLRWAEEPIAQTGKPRPVIELREAARRQRLVGDSTQLMPVPGAAAEQKQAMEIAEPSEIEDARSRQDCVQMLHAALTNTVSGLRNIPVFIERAFEKQCWTKERILPEGGKQPAVTFHEFVHCPYPIGLGFNYTTLRELICGDVMLPNHPELLAAFDKATPEAPDDDFLSSHDRCIRLEDLSAGWDQSLAAAVVDDVIREALRAPDAPKPPAPNGTRELVETLRRWIEQLAPTTETAAESGSSGARPHLTKATMAYRHP
jgi:hypothetical protein